MAARDASPSPLASSALDLIRDGATSRQLARRFRDAGAPIADEIVDDLLSQLADLGLARVERVSGAGPVYVRTARGKHVMDGEPVVGERDADLRSALADIRSAVGRVLDPTSPDDERHALIETIDRAAARMQGLLDDDQPGDVTPLSP